jgi:DNA polymerase III subunit epsilon
VSVLIFDTEATDLIPGQICQLSYLLVDIGNVTGKNLFFEVDDMSEGALEVHGLTLDMLRELSGGQRFEDAAQDVLQDFAAAGLWVGHNVSADERYLRVEMERCGLKLPKKPTFCTMNYFTSDMNLTRKVNIGRPKPPKLTELAQFFDLSEDFVAEKAAEWFGGGGALHDARFDTAATYLCLVEGTKRGRVRGVL